MLAKEASDLDGVYSSRDFFNSSSEYVAETNSVFS
jgi:hypothetical protein